MAMLKVIEECLEEQGVYVESLVDHFTEDTEFREDLSLDDDTLSELMYTVEARYDISLPENTMKDCKTVEDLMKKIREKIY